MSEQPVDLRASLRAVWRRRLVVGAAIVIGAAGGAALGLSAGPAMPEAETLVVLPPPTATSAGVPARDMRTQTIIASSRPVLSAAGRSVSPPIGAADLVHQVTVTAVSRNVLEIRARAPVSGDAQVLANAIARDYIHYVSVNGATATVGALAGLRHQASTLDRQVSGLRRQIAAVSARLADEAASSAAGQRDASLLASLRSEQQQLSLQVDSVNDQIASTQLSDDSGAGFRILQRAEVVPAASRFRPPIVGGLVGAGIGLLVGVVLALVRSGADHRLRRRDEIARSVGAPVIATLEAQQRKTAAAWHRFFEDHQPSSVDAWGLRRTLHHLAASEDAAVRVVSLAGDWPALDTGPQLAVYARTLGVPTAIATSGHDMLVPLRAAYGTRGGDGGGHRGGGEDVARPDGAPNGSPVPVRPALTVSIVVADRERPELPSFPGASLVSVSSGLATAEDLSRLALAIADSGRAADGIVVVNADPVDATTGTDVDGAGTRPWPHRLSVGDWPAATAGEIR